MMSRDKAKGEVLPSPSSCLITPKTRFTRPRMIGRIAGEAVLLYEFGRRTCVGPQTPLRIQDERSCTSRLTSVRMTSLLSGY